jgi:hypothetical protein
MNRITNFYWIFLVPACLLTFAHSYLGYVGTWFGSPHAGLVATLFHVQQMLPFVLFLFVFVSLRLCVWLLWSCFASDFVLTAVSSFSSPHFHLSYRILYFPVAFLFHLSGFNRWLIAAAILTQLAYVLKKRRQPVQHEKTG